MPKVGVESIFSWEGSIHLGLSGLHYSNVTLGRCGYSKKETMETVGIMQRMTLEVQLLGRDQTWYPVLNRDTRIGDEAYDF